MADEMSERELIVKFLERTCDVVLSMKGDTTDGILVSDIIEILAKAITNGEHLPKDESNDGNG